MARYLPPYHLGGDRPRIDYIGAALFAAALVPILVGTDQRSIGRRGPTSSVGGLIVIGLLVGGLRVRRVTRAGADRAARALFRIRTFTVSVVAIFLAAFGFFATVVFLPRWFQVVNGSSATESGYQILPLLGGLIISAVASGQIVARTGRYQVAHLRSARH